MLFELLPYPMDIVITFLKPSKFYINVEESTTCHEHIWQSGRSEVAAVYGNYTIEVQKKLRGPVKDNIVLRSNYRYVGQFTAIALLGYMARTNGDGVNQAKQFKLVWMRTSLIISNFDRCVILAMQRFGPIHYGLIFSRHMKSNNIITNAGLDSYSIASS